MRAAALLLVLVSSAAVAADGPLTVLKRSRVEEPGTGYVVKEAKEAWQPGQTAIIVCDMWDSHHCLNAVRRAVEMAPRMNEVLQAARGRGVLDHPRPQQLHGGLQDHPARKLAQSAPAAANLPADIGQWCRQIPAEDKGDLSHRPDRRRRGRRPGRAQAAGTRSSPRWAAIPKRPGRARSTLLDIDDGDAISDRGVEIWNLLEARGINNVILLGVHTNMCVLGRPFGLRQMAKNGKNVVLMRDMTDTMYNPAQWPFVSHFTGTDLIVEHIEKYVCPTITSADFLGGQPFRFSRDRRRVCLIIGEDEYKTGDAARVRRERLRAARL